MGLTAGPGCIWEHPPPPSLPNGPNGSFIIYCYSGGPFNYNTSEPRLIFLRCWQFQIEYLWPHQPSLKWSRFTSESPEPAPVATPRQFSAEGHYVLCWWGEGGGWSQWQQRDVHMAPFVVDSSQGGFIKLTRFHWMHHTTRVIPVLFPLTSYWRLMPGGLWFLVPTA